MKKRYIDAIQVDFPYRIQSENYVIEFTEYLKSGGFANTYIGNFFYSIGNQKNKESKKIVIKEFFMSDACRRDNDGLTVLKVKYEEYVNKYENKFLEEVKTLAKLDHNNIVKVYHSFKANNTSYYVMDFIDGISLAEFRPNEKLTFSEAWKILRPICIALQNEVHKKGIIHADISPTNILIENKTLRPILIDFGLCRAFSQEKGGIQISQTKVTTTSAGYSAYELHNPRDEQGKISTIKPCTDIHSLGAVMYYLIEREHPKPLIDSQKTSNENLLNILKKTTRQKQSDRFQSVQELIDACDKLAKYTVTTPIQEIEQTKPEDENSGYAFGGTQIRPKTPQTTGNNEKEEEKLPVIEKEKPIILPNDPCPCGSGRKFKQCHGKNIVIENNGQNTNGGQKNGNGENPPVITPPQKEKPTFWQQYGKITIIAFVVAIVAAVATSIDWSKEPTPEPDPTPTPDVITPEEKLYATLLSIQQGETDRSKADELFTEDAYFVIIDEGVMAGSPTEPSHQMEHLLIENSRINLEEYKLTKIYRDNPNDDRITSIDLEPINE